MNVSLCDVCLSEGKTFLGTFRAGLRGGPYINLCKEHRSFGQKMNPEQFTNARQKLLEKIVVTDFFRNK